MYKYCLATLLTGMFLGCGATNSDGTMTMTTPTPTCSDASKNGSETDVDCGGSCGPCAILKACSGNTDCASGVCNASQCVAVSCMDGLKNGSETDVDCGGPACAACIDTKACAAAKDCASGVCTGNICQGAGCTDGVKNGTETDVDCGGGSCGACAPTKACTAAADCASGVCSDKFCQAASCTDAVKNGNETDKDCGGADCQPCAVGATCKANADCGVALCKATACYMPTSCADIHQIQPNLADGIYTINGGDNTSSFMAYCDMTRDNGGWTLILKANSDSTMAYDSAYWTDTNLLNETELNTKSGNAKYPGFLKLNVNKLRGELVNQGRFFKTFDGTMTASQIFNGPIQSENALPDFQDNNPDWSIQPYCQSYGVNVFWTPSNPSEGRVRMGYTANQEMDCSSNDTAIGLGASYGYNGINYGAGLITFYGGNKGDKNIPADGLLWVQ